MAKRVTQERGKRPNLIKKDGGLCAAFVNSASKKRRGFASYGELVGWSVACDVLSGGEGQRLSREAQRRPEDADAVAQRALALRAGLRRILQALATRAAPAAADLAALNSGIASALAARYVAPATGGYRWAWGDRDGDDLDRMLWPVLLDAGELLCSKHHRKVRRCAGDDCDLLFVDRTPGSPRRWCSMRACGNRVKGRRHYHSVVKPGREARKERLKRR